MTSNPKKKLFRVGPFERVKKLGRDNFPITDDQITELIERHENGDFGDMSVHEHVLNMMRIEKPDEHINGSVQSRYTLGGGTVSISTTGIGLESEPVTEILFNNREGGVHNGTKRDDGKPIPLLT